MSVGVQWLSWRLILSLIQIIKKWTQYAMLHADKINFCTVVYLWFGQLVSYHSWLLWCAPLKIESSTSAISSRSLPFWSKAVKLEPCSQQLHIYHHLVLALLFASLTKADLRGFAWMEFGWKIGRQLQQTKSLWASRHVFWTNVETIWAWALNLAKIPLFVLEIRG